MNFQSHGLTQKNSIGTTYITVNKKCRETLLFSNYHIFKVGIQKPIGFMKIKEVKKIFFKDYVNCKRGCFSSEHF